MSKSLIPRPPAQLAPPLETAPPTPYSVFSDACHPASRGTMRARLDAAARILADSDAETFLWQGLDYAACNRVVAALADAKASPATINLTRSALRKMAKVLFNLRMLDPEERRRIDDIPPAKGKRRPRGRALSERELRKLLIACRRDTRPTGARDAALLACLYGGGLRRDEASRLDVGDLDANGKRLKVRGKGDRVVMQPVGAEVVEAVEAWVGGRGDRPGGLFLVVDKFGRVQGRRLSGNAIWWAVQRRASEAGIESLSPHDFRRSFVTGLLVAGEDLSAVAKAARHASVTTTARYDLRDETKVAETVAKLRWPGAR